MTRLHLSAAAVSYPIASPLSPSVTELASALALLRSRTEEISPIGSPVAFDGSVGLLYPGSGPVAVLMLSAIGYEEMCLRTTWRSLAEAISGIGAPCLRFDYPGVGDAIDPISPPDGLDDWFASVRAAARYLREATGRSRIVVVGQGFGGALAGLLARELAPVEGVVFMAPVVSGRHYLRELSLWARMLTERIGIGPDPDDASGLAVAGLALDAGRAKAIKTLDLMGLDAAPAGRALLVGRVNHGGDERFAEKLKSFGVEVSRRDYTGYEVLATDPTQARPPLEVVRDVAAWIGEIAAETPVGSLPPQPISLGAPGDAYIHGEGFRERPVRFGPNDALFGVVCEPDRPYDGSAAVFANAGRDYHIGWARATVEQARALARLGIASLRFDAAGLGDSPAGADGGAEVLYCQSQVDDVRFAVDKMRLLAFKRIMLIGRCSGAWAVFNAAVDDDRIHDVVMINTERFVWDPRENLAEALRYAHRSIGNFGTTLWKHGGWKRLLRGQLRVAAAGKYVAQRLLKKASVRLAPMLGEMTHQAKLYREVHRRFAKLEARGARTWLVYSDGDLGLKELQTYFGDGGRRLAGYPGVGRVMIEAADHNFTHKGARRRLLSALERIVAR